MIIRECVKHTINVLTAPYINDKCSIQNLENGDDYDKVNSIISEWCKLHPTKTRQSEFLKLYPKASMDKMEPYKGRLLSICPKKLDTSLSCCTNNTSCLSCRKEYWLTPIENEVSKHENIKNK